MKNDQVFELLQWIADKMCIGADINLRYLRNNGNAEDIKDILRGLRVFTGYEGRIPLNVTQNNHIEYLASYNDYCGFYTTNNDSDNEDYDFNPLQGSR